jgi:quinol monooxygenase YgiN
MYGTVAHLRVKPGQEQGVIDYANDWTHNRKPEIPGAVGGYVYRLDSDPGVWVFAVAFRDRESYRANAESPAMDADYQRLRALLTEDPIWQDGEIVAEF